MMLRYPIRIFTQYESNVGYAPYRIVRDTPLLTGPGPEFPKMADLTLAFSWFGWQSVRNEARSATPPLRGTQNGYAWGYSYSKHFTGWVKVDDLEVNPHTGWADGPAHVDFEIGTGTPRRKVKPRFTIGRRVSGHATILPVTDEKVPGVRATYLRYAPRGTAFYYLQPFDEVAQLWRGVEFTGIEVVKSKSAKVGTRGWVLTRNLNFKREG